jgi:hypothetical protein
MALLLKVRITSAPALAVKESLWNVRSSLLAEPISRVTLPPPDGAAVVAVGATSAGDVDVGAGDVAVGAGDVAVGRVVGVGSSPPQAKPTTAVTTSTSDMTQVFFNSPPYRGRQIFRLVCRPEFERPFQNVECTTLGESVQHFTILGGGSSV